MAICPPTGSTGTQLSSKDLTPWAVATGAKAKSPQRRSEAPPKTEIDPVRVSYYRGKEKYKRRARKAPSCWEAEPGTACAQAWRAGARPRGPAAVARHLQAPYLGPVSLLGHHLCLLLQQGTGELLCLPRLLLFLCLLLVRFPGLQLALCHLDTQSKSTRPGLRPEPCLRSGGKLWTQPRWRV